MTPEFKMVSADVVAPLRTSVLRPNWDDSVPLYYEEDRDPWTRHGALLVANNPIAVATFIRQTSPVDGRHAYRLRGMAVASTHQRQGYGARVLNQSRIELAQTVPSIETLWCNARESAIPFYERHGFEPHGPMFDIDGIGPHVVMWCKL